MRKKFLSVFLLLAMVLALLPGIAQAADTGGGARTADTSGVAVIATGISADSVVNYDGYGSLKINGDWDYDWDAGVEMGTPAQLALIDSSGTFILPYQADPVGGFFGDAQFIYSDGIASLVMNSAYYGGGGTPQYFNLDGTPAFTLENTENEYTDENGTLHYESTYYNHGSPMRDGYAVVIQTFYSYAGGSGSGGGGVDGYKTMIVDRNGKVTCELPQEFNEGIAMGALGFDTKMSLGWCGEGLFAFFENEYVYYEDPYGWDYISAGKGYMDHTGKTVIDLSGRGYQNLGPFHEGLAYAKDETGKYGFIDKTGELVIPCQYDDVGYFYDGLCWVGKDGKWGYIDKTGEVVIPLEYDDAYGAGAGLAAVVKGGKCGLVDYDNNIVVPLEYDDISSNEGGVAYGIKAGLLYIITAADDTPAAAKVGDRLYTTVQDAVNIIKVGETIELTGKATADELGTLKAPALEGTFYITGPNAGSVKFSAYTVNGYTYTATVTVNSETSVTVTVTRTAVSGGPVGGGGGASTTTPTTSSVTVSNPGTANGTVTANTSAARKGDTVTVTSKANSGYISAAPIVKDKNGNTVAVVKKANGTWTFTMPEGGVTVTGNYVTPGQMFSDVNDSLWYRESIAYAVENGLMDGMGGGEFRPGATTTRGMVMTILARQLGVDTTPASGEAWYQKGMDWAKQAGVSDGSNPGGNISREQLATMLWRFAGEPAVTGDLSAYPDAGGISDWAGTAMAWAVKTGIIEGSDGKLDPQGNATRAQAAAMLMRFCESIAK